MNSSIWPRDGTLIGTTNSCQSGPRNNGNIRVLHILQSSRTGVSPSKVSYPKHQSEGYYPSVGMQSAYSIAPANRVTKTFFPRGRHISWYSFFIVKSLGIFFKRNLIGFNDFIVLIKFSVYLFFFFLLFFIIFNGVKLKKRA